MRSLLTLMLLGLSPAFAVEKVPVTIELPEEVLAELDAQGRADVERIKTILEQRLYKWANFPIELPPTVFDAEDGRIIELNDLFQQPGADELVKLAVGADGKRKKLSVDQLAQIKQEALFVVPSEEYPGQNHVWKIGLFLQKGRKNIAISLEQAKGRALTHLIVRIPARVTGETPLSLKRGVRNLYEGLKETAGLFIGISERHRTFSDSEIEAKIDEARVANQEIAWNGNEYVQSRDLRSKRVDLRLYDDKLMEKVAPIVAKLEEQAANRWAENVDTVTATLRHQLQALPAEQRAQELADALARTEQLYFYQEIAASPEVEALSPGIGRLLVNHGRAIQVVMHNERLFAEEIAAYREIQRLELERTHPVKSKAEGWLEAELARVVDAYYKERFWQFYFSLESALKNEGLDEQANLLVRDLYFLKQHEARIRAELEAQTEASREFAWNRRVWRVSRWKVVSVKDPEGKHSHYDVVRNKTYTVDTGAAGWRLANLAQETAWAFNNGLYHLLVTNLYNGPLGFRALLNAKPFRYEWEANEQGKLELSSAERMTYLARLKKFYQTRREILDNHRRKTDFGLFGKHVERFGLFFTADLGLGVLAPAITAVGQPVLTLGNGALSALGTATSVIWAPVSSLLTMGFNAALYDTWGTTHRRWKRGFDPAQSRFLPLVSRLLIKAGIKGVGETVGSAAAIVAYHPAAATTHYVLGKTRSLARKAWDSAWLAVMGKLGFIPARDSRFFVKRIQGPGLSNEYFYQVSPDLAVVALRAQMEETALGRYAESTRAVLEQPRENYRKVMAAFEAVLASGREELGRNGPAARDIDKTLQEQRKALDTAVAERQKEYRTLLDVPGRGHIKLTRADLEDALRKGTVLARQFYEAEFARGSWSGDEVKKFWKSYQLEAGDWVGLARRQLGAVLGGEILVPLEETDKTLTLKVEDPTVRDYAKGLTSGLMPEHLRDVKLDGELAPAPGNERLPESKVPRVDASRICESLLVNRG